MSDHSPETTKQRNAHNFDFHQQTADSAPKHRAVLDEMLATANRIVDLTPPGREQSVALTKLEEAMFWANAAIARQA